MSKENPKWTVAQRSAWIDSHVFGFGRAIQAFGVDRFRKNCQQMVGGFNFVLCRMFPETASEMAHLISDETYTQAKKEALKDLCSKAMEMKDAPKKATDLKDAAKKTTDLKDAAKMATDLAKSKAGPIYASCQPNQT